MVALRREQEETNRKLASDQETEIQMADQILQYEKALRELTTVNAQLVSQKLFMAVLQLYLLTNYIDEDVG